MLSSAAFQRQLMRRKLWGKQVEICQAIETHRSVSVKGCHGSGKTWTVAGIVPYELLAHDESIVLTVAPTLRQVKLMWSEIHAAIQSLPMRAPEPTTTGWELTEKCKAIGFSSSKGVNAQGFHGKRVLIIADEAVGISSELWDAIEGIRMAGDVRIVKLCNPTTPSGPVYEDFTRLRGQPGHKCITISAFDTPNLAGLTMESLLALPESELDYAPFPMLARRRAVLELWHKWGPTNPRFIARVLGEFPSQADDSVFKLEWIENAGLPYEADELAPFVERGTFIQVGIDVAGAGSDETVATARMAGFVLASQAWPDPDPYDACCRFLGDIRARYPRSPMIVVGDTVGIGYHFMHAISRAGFEVLGFVANEAPMNPVQFVNKKAEAYFQLREYMRAGLVHGVEDEICKAQLSDIRYRETLGRVEIEHKREVKARGGSSPDRAESLIIAFWKFALRSQQFDAADRVAISLV